MTLTLHLPNTGLCPLSGFGPGHLPSGSVSPWRLGWPTVAAPALFMARWLECHPTESYAPGVDPGEQPAAIAATARTMSAPFGRIPRIRGPPALPPPMLGSPPQTLPRVAGSRPLSPAPAALAGVRAR